MSKENIMGTDILNQVLFGNLKESLNVSAQHQKSSESRQEVTF